MPAKSKAQQKFMGMVHGVQKGTIKPSTVSAKVKKAAKGMKKKSATDYASTKHKGLPKKVTVKEISKWLKKLEEFRYRKVRGVDARRVASFVNRGMNEEDLPMSLRKKWEHRKYGREKYLANRYMKENGYDSVQKEGFGGELNDKDKQKFEKARKNNAEVLGYELSGTPDVKEDRDYKAEYKKYGSSTKAKKYRAELNQYNRKKGTYGNGDGKDASHKGGKIAGFENQSVNRGRAEKSRLRKEARAILEADFTDDTLASRIKHWSKQHKGTGIGYGHVLGQLAVHMKEMGWNKSYKEVARIAVELGKKKKVESVNEGTKTFLAYRKMKEGMEDVMKSIRELRGHIDNAPYNKKFNMITSELYKWEIDLEKKWRRVVPQISKISKDKMLESVNEGKWSKIMTSVRKGSKAGPWSIVVYKNKKVIHQRPVKILQQIPAHYEDVKKKYSKAKIGIEDKYGERVYTESVNEGFTKYTIKLTKTPGWYLVHDKKGKQKFEGDRKYVAKELKKLKTRMGSYQLKNLIKVADKYKGKGVTFDVVESVNEGKKRYYQQDRVGSAKYTISYHDGKQKHKDGSDFFGIKTFRNKKDLAKFVNTLSKSGYVYGFNESVNELKQSISGNKMFMKRTILPITKKAGIKKVNIKELPAQFDDDKDKIEITFDVDKETNDNFLDLLKKKAGKKGTKKRKNFNLTVQKEATSKPPIKEAGMGILDSDQSDILQGIVMRNKNKSLKSLLSVVLKSGYFKGVDKKELLGYIDGARQFVKYMKSHPMESVNEDIGIDTYLGGIIKAMRNAGLKPKTAKQMKSGFSKSKDKIGFFIDVEQRGFDKIEKYTLQIEVDKKGDLWYLSGNRPVHMGPWADTNRITRMFRMLNKIRGFGQTKFGKV